MIKQRHHFASKGAHSQSYGFSSSHIWVWKLDHKEGWAPKNSCSWTVVVEKTVESPLDSKEIKPVHLKGNQSWIFIGRTDAEAPILWPPDLKSWLTGKDPDAGNDWGQEEKGAAEDEMVKWNHWLNGHEFEQTLGDSEGQGSIVCCSPWGHRVGHDLETEQQQAVQETSWFTLFWSGLQTHELPVPSKTFFSLSLCNSPSTLADSCWEPTLC